MKIKFQNQKIGQSSKEKIVKIDNWLKQGMNEKLEMSREMSTCHRVAEKNVTIQGRRVLLELVSNGVGY